MEAINVFHVLFITNVRFTVKGRKGQPEFIISRPMLQLIILSTVFGVLTFASPWSLWTSPTTRGIQGVTIILRIVLTLAISFLLALDSFFGRHKLLRLARLLYRTEIAGLPKRWLSLRAAQIAITTTCDVYFLVEASIAAFRTNALLLVVGQILSTMVARYILLTALLCQTFAECHAWRYRWLRNNLRHKLPDQQTVHELDALFDIKQLLSEVVGLKIMLVTLDLMLNLSFCSYDLIQKILRFEPLPAIAKLICIDMVDSVMLFALCCSYNQLATEANNLQSGKFTGSVMQPLAVLNIFNYLLVSHAYVTVDSRWKSYTFRERHFFLHILMITAVVLLVNYCELLVFVEQNSELSKNVIGAVTLLKYGCNLLIYYPVLLWRVLYRRNIIDLCHRMITIDRTFYDVTHSWPSYRSLTVIKYLLAMATINFATIFLYNNYITWKHVLAVKPYILITQNAGVLLEYGSHLQVVFLQFFACYLRQRYNDLRVAVPNLTGQQFLTLIQLYNALEAYKETLSDTFGPLQVILTFFVFVNSSVHVYVVVFLVQKSILSAIPMPTMQLCFYLLLYYYHFYVFNSIESGEQEFKNTIKSVQYEQYRTQTDECKDFLDLINLKILAESPKITACGLFEVNMQIFYNVFAAIVTYIVILFQFQDFEK